MVDEGLVGRISFRRVTRDDFALLGRWLAEPHVYRWWHHRPDPESVAADFGPAADGEEPSEDHLALLDGEPIGLVQYSRFTDHPEYRDEVASHVDVGDASATIDYFVGEPSLVGRGVGSAMLTAFVAYVWATDPRTAELVVAVHADNVASWRALQRIGFRIVARGDLEPDNPADSPDHLLLRLPRLRP